MANPNIKSATSLLAKNADGVLTTSAVSLLSNAASSGKLLKITSIIVSNVDGTNNAELTMSRYSQAAIAGTPYRIANTMIVPADASLQLVDKDHPIFLLEDKSIGGLANANNDLEYLIDYEEYS